MANQFTEIAKKETTLSPVMENREKLKTKDIIRAFPNGITITEFDFCNGKTKNGEITVYPVLAYAENPKAFFCGGTVLNKICVAWANAFDGDTQAASDALKASGGVKVIMSEGTTRDGNNVTNVIVCD